MDKLPYGKKPRADPDFRAPSFAYDCLGEKEMQKKEKERASMREKEIEGDIKSQSGRQVTGLTAELSHNRCR